MYMCIYIYIYIYVYDFLRFILNSLCGSGVSMALGFCWGSFLVYFLVPRTEDDGTEAPTEDSLMYGPMVDDVHPAFPHNTE